MSRSVLPRRKEQISQQQRAEVLIEMSSLMQEGSLLLQQLDVKTSVQIAEEGAKSPIGRAVINIAEQTANDLIHDMYMHMYVCMHKYRYVCICNQTCERAEI